ncbi:MAG: tetratricopeptide repeat protein [Proteobacteria bacterium]|nr:tetratricopeptide repeat protein [Pseudomonadota bacterium]
MPSNRHWFLLPALAMSVALLAPLVASAQDDQVQQTERHGLVNKKQPVAPKLYPNATRAEPAANASSDAMVKNVNQLHALVAAKQDDQAIALANGMIADPKANHFDKAAAWQAIGYASFGKSDYAKAAQALGNAIAEDALPNNDHYQTMLNLAKAQLATAQYDAALATLNRLATETRDDKPEYDGLRGLAYFSKKDYAAAVPVLQKSIAASVDKPSANEQQALFGSYFELKQSDKAIALGEALLKTHPDDKAATMNLAAAYQQAGQPDKTKALLGQARKAGMLTTSDDYRKLIQLYNNAKGGESDTIGIINEGLQKGILQPSVDVYAILAQDYYTLNQTEQAIDAYKKADALSSNGEEALNLARVYNNAGRRAEAKAAAEHALSKGVTDRGAAQRIINAGAVPSPPKKKR